MVGKLAPGHGRSLREEGVFGGTPKTTGGTPVLPIVLPSAYYVSTTRQPWPSGLFSDFGVRELPSAAWAWSKSARQ